MSEPKGQYHQQIEEALRAPLYLHPQEPARQEHVVLVSSRLTSPPPQLGDTVYYWEEMEHKTDHTRVLVPFAAFVLGTPGLVSGEVAGQDLEQEDVYVVWVPLLNANPQPKVLRSAPTHGAITSRWGLDGKPVPVL